MDSNGSAVRTRRVSARVAQAPGARRAHRGRACSSAGSRRRSRRIALSQPETPSRGIRHPDEHARPRPPPRRRSLATQQLLATTDDPNACAVSFAGDGVADEPVLQTQGALYAGLPIPPRDGLVFAGWYATPADAAAFSIPARINGSELVACTDQQITLHGSWKTPEENAAEDARIPIMMYHQFTTRPEGEDGWLRGNYAYIGDFDAHMNHIADDRASTCPTWDELSAFIDGRLFLPTHSVIVTDDDADQTWFDLAVPVVDKYKVLTTSFMITAYRQDPPPNPYVLRRSHTHDMHQAGANGDGRIVNWTVPEIVADMETSAGVLGRQGGHGLPVRPLQRHRERGPAPGGLRDGPHDRARLRDDRHRQARAAGRAHQLRHGARRASSTSSADGRA